ncbi:MAG: hypothetical protein HY788_03225 [Deltaproteobacteria bacterium]|nr:hypothetical protein [Deltaproteobacteria bacterium]
MILNPAIIALILGSLLLSLFAVYSSAIGWRIIRRWDIRSGSELQVSLERKTYLISTVLAYLMGFQLFSFFLFIYTSDVLHEIFIGAMCAAGTLNVDPHGYPALLVKIANVVSCGVWLSMNHIDNQAEDYPLIRPKYKFLMFLTGMLLLETYLQLRYFSGMRADVITSCCGTLFSESSETITGELAGIPSIASQIILFASFLLTIRVGGYYLWTGKGAKAFSRMSVWFFVFALVALISFISLYYYELPTHHCPFCVLQKEYHYIGYPMYITLLTGSIFGISVGLMNRYRDIDSLKSIIAKIQVRWCWAAMLSYLAFMLIALYPMIFSDFHLEGSL